ncbi:hypothetical protein JB92DRAFT_3132754 [Gautieria morchelliformis]|nr:hypothetical protein JB92DRAFT_3132754 [Gautieria morchelliformis]
MLFSTCDLVTGPGLGLVPVTGVDVDADIDVDVDVDVDTKGFDGQSNIKALEDILKLSSYLMIEAGRSFAIAEVEHRYLTPTVKLLMAQRHQISNWVPGAVQALVMRPPSFFTLAEYEALGTRNIYTLEKVRTQIQHHRLCVAFHSPNIIHEERLCLQKDACGDAWEASWWG